MNRLKYKDASLAQKAAPARPIQAARRQRQLHPFLFRMGPLPLTISSVLLIGLMATLYLSQLGQAVSANQQIQDYRAAQVALQRQNQDLVNTLAQEQSPAYIAARARALGLVPEDTKEVTVVVVRHLRPVPGRNVNIEP